MNSPWDSTRNVSSRVRNICLNSFGFRCLFLLASVMSLSLLALGQQATIVGTVTDPSGAALPGVTITVTSLDSSAVKKIRTNDAGQYVVPDLNIGHYSVKAESSGFKTAEQKNVALQVGDRDRIDFHHAGWRRSGDGYRRSQSSTCADRFWRAEQRHHGAADFTDRSERAQHVSTWQRWCRGHRVR